MPIKTLHITNYYHKDSGGISTSYNNLLAAANRHKRYVRLIVPGESEELEEIGEYGRIYYVTAEFSPIFDKRYRIMKPWQYMIKDSVIRKILLQEMPDMIEVCDKYTLSYLAGMIRMNYFKKMGRPMLVHFSCERMDDNVVSFLTKATIGKWFAKRMMGNYVFPLFDYHIANSAYTAEEFYEALEPNRLLNPAWRFFRSAIASAKERIFICPRGVDTGQFSPSKKDDEFKRAIRKKHGLPEDSIILLYAGRLSPEKNLELLPSLMKLLAKDERHDFRLLTAGAGPQAEWLAKETKRNFPGKIIQLGHLDKEELSKLYANCDIFIHPNPREPFGIAPLEAMASGAALLAPNSGGILSYANNENAWLMEPGAGNFAEAIEEIINNPALKESKIKKAIETAQNNTREKSTDFLLATYDKLYEDFTKRKELFADRERAKTYDFAAMIKE